MTENNRENDEPLDEDYSPPDQWSVAEGYGNTALEEELGETLDQRLAQEEPEPDPYLEAANEADEDAGGEDQGAASSAEEAAVHVLDDEE